MQNARFADEIERLREDLAVAHSAAEQVPSSVPDNERCKGSWWSHLRYGASINARHHRPRQSSACPYFCIPIPVMSTCMPASMTASN